MSGMSERQYAAHAGISRGAVQKAKAAGRLVLLADGSIDAAASDRRRAAATDPAKRGARPALSAAGGSEMKPVAEAALGSVREMLKEHGLPSNRISFVEARTAHEIAKAHLTRLRLQERRGELVDRAGATGLVFRLARQERDAWINWPARVAALMAAELGVEAHAMQRVLEAHVRAHLAELAEVRPEFR
ncbi:hypothetical protein GCM10007972_24710 [Iodidimonas muriae]|uniref:Elements of external origin n=1 Tax=Iodidimonas muriae TaxID=261467 RepID=A0ABQ2LGM9_9PROT|nr:hypothetical protein [Iodidimonas muriae]GGO16076.1 hypothetical protein GCM10007972_24710 [Iodidimonas muriae]